MGTEQTNFPRDQVRYNNNNYKNYGKKFNELKEKYAVEAYNNAINKEH